MFITKKVFDPGLAGKAVHISGYDVDGDPFDRIFLIKSVHGEKLNIINCQGKEINLHMENFEHEEGLKLQILELPKQNVIEVETEEHKGRQVRDELQIKVDNKHLEHLLRENIEPLQLQEITKRMRENHGHEHWTKKNSSSFVNFAIKCGMKIKKSGYGFYGYDWEAK